MLAPAWLGVYFARRADAAMGAKASVNGSRPGLRPWALHVALWTRACTSIPAVWPGRFTRTVSSPQGPPAKLNDKLLEELGAEVLKIGPALDVGSPDFQNILSRQRGRDGDSMLKKVDAHFVGRAAIILATPLDSRPARTPALTDKTLRHPPADEDTALNPDLRLAFRSAVGKF